MNGVSCQMSISISFQSKFVLNGNAMVDRVNRLLIDPLKLFL